MKELIWGRRGTIKRFAVGIGLAVFYVSSALFEYYLGSNGIRSFSLRVFNTALLCALVIYAIFPDEW